MKNPAVTRGLWRPFDAATMKILLGTQMIAKGLDFPT